MHTHSHARTHNRCHFRVEVPHGKPGKVRFQFRHMPGKFLGFKGNGDPHLGGGGDWYVTQAVESRDHAPIALCSPHAPQVPLQSEKVKSG